MKKFHIIAASLLLSVALFLNFAPLSFAGVAIPGANEFKNVSSGPADGGDSLEKIQKGGFRVLQSIKIVISFLAVIYLVYAGAMMVTAMGDEKAITSSRRQIMYSVVAFLFVNIPGQIYALFARKQVSSVTDNVTTNFTNSANGGSNIFFNFSEWNSTVENGILSFIRVGIIGAAIFMFSLAAFEVITS